MSNLYLREKHHLRRKLPVYAEGEPIDVHTMAELSPGISDVTEFVGGE